MDVNQSEPYAFSFDTKSKPGVMLVHCVRFETIEAPLAAKDREFTIFGRDINSDPRQAEFLMTVKSILSQ